METTDKIFTTDGSNSFANGAMMGASRNKNANDPALMAAMMNGAAQGGGDGADEHRGRGRV